MNAINFTTPAGDNINIIHYDSCGFVVDYKSSNAEGEFEITDEQFAKITEFANSRKRAEKIIFRTECGHWVSLKETKSYIAMFIYKDHELFGKSLEMVGYANDKLEAKEMMNYMITL